MNHVSFKAVANYNYKHRLNALASYKYRLTLKSTDAQLTPPDEAVCVGEQVVFVCQQTGSTLRWTVDLPGGISNELVNTASSSQAGIVSMFTNDPYGFEIHVLSSSSSSSVISELHVTAVRQLNGVTVECEGGIGRYMSTIQIASVGESALLIQLYRIKLSFSTLT